MARQGSGPDVAFPAESKGEVFQLQAWKGVNTRSPRTSIDDQEPAWSENLLRLGDGNYRSLYDSEPPIPPVAPPTARIIHMYFYTINIQEPTPGHNTIRNMYVIFFYTDGSAKQWNFSTAVETVVAGPGTFFAFDPTPAAVQVIPDVVSFDANGILIICTFGYFAWDGTTLYTNPGNAPLWLTNGVAGQVMPVISGQSIEIYKQRVWISNGRFIFFSAPLDGTKFVTNGGGAFGSTDSFLKSFITALRQANGFLYVFGDSSISVISNVQTSGSPAVTTFNYDSIDQVIGTIWRETIRPFGRALLFANIYGVYSLAGSAVEKLSNPLDGVFRRANINIIGLQDPIPRAAHGVIFDIRCYVFVISTLDPMSNTNRELAFIWDGEHWYPASQSRGLFIITQQEIDSAVFIWGTDGTVTFKMFQIASSTLPKNFRTKLWRTKMQDWVTAQALRFVSCVFDHVGSGVSLSFTCDSDARASDPPVVVSGMSGINFQNNSLAAIIFVNADGSEISFVKNDVLFIQQNINQYGRSMGLTVTTTAPDFSMVDAGLLVQQWAPHA
jgi:hypothetical protein